MRTDRPPERRESTQRRPRLRGVRGRFLAGLDEPIDCHIRNVQGDKCVLLSEPLRVCEQRLLYKHYFLYNFQTFIFNIFSFKAVYGLTSWHIIVFMTNRSQHRLQ